MSERNERYLIAKRALFDRYYGSLNNEQREAIYHINNPLLILAGAGSGKTTVLVRRIAYIIRFGNAYFSDYVPFDLDPAHVTALEEAVKAELPREELEALLSEFANNPCPPWRILAITFTNKAAGGSRQDFLRLSRRIPRFQAAFGREPFTRFACGSCAATARRQVFARAFRSTMPMIAKKPCKRC